jgi:hypothetical protein
MAHSNPFRNAEIDPPPPNAAEPRAFRALVRNELERPDWLAGAAQYGLRRVSENSIVTSER